MTAYFREKNIFVYCTWRKTVLWCFSDTNYFTYYDVCFLGL